MTAPEQHYDAPLREHSFDGIQEFNNRLPNWWLWSFYLACIFSVFYWIHYHTLGTGDLPNEAYRKVVAAEKAAMEAREAAQPVSDESLLAVAGDPAVVEAGKKLWLANCLACHKADGGGLVGPNLTDKFWLHGGKPTQILKTVREGVPAKGMIPWQNMLGTSGCKEVVAYVLAEIKGKNVAGGKEPQGEPEGQ